jgi:hypothetical protein
MDRTLKDKSWRSGGERGKKSNQSSGEDDLEDEDVKMSERSDISL